MRLFTATLAHETAPFSPIPTNMENFRKGMLNRPSHGEFVEGRLEAVECGLTMRGAQRGHDVVEGLGAAATPSGRTVKADYEAIRDELLDDLKNALPVDAVGLFLHGAQMAQGYDDCEGDLLQRVRELVGPDVPVGVEFDLHGNVTQAMVDSATFLVACREYPHVDFPERAEQLLDLLEQAVAGQIAPVSTRVRVPMLGIFHTTREPMKGFVDAITKAERRPGVLCISAAHGFPWADTPDTCATITVTTDGDAELAQSVAREMAEQFFALRAVAGVHAEALEDTIAKALEPAAGLTVLADTADNAGGGAASDATFILRSLLDRGVEKNTALGVIWDPQAVELAFAAGEGAQMPMRIGGKTSPLSGDPVDMNVTVEQLTEHGRQFAFGTEEKLGRMAHLLTEGGMSIVIGSRREQVHSPEAFLSVGVDPRDYSLLVLKSAQHFHARFSPLAERIFYAVGRGTTSVDFTSFDYQNLTRPIWPLDALESLTESAA